MAEASQLPEVDRDGIARLLGPWVQHESGLLGLVMRPELAEGYEVWVLDEARQAEPVRVRDKAAFGGEWHHQIRAGAGTPLAARAAQSEDVDGAAQPGAGWRITTVFSGRLVEDIQATSDLIDGNDRSDDLARILLAPSRMRTLFWLESPTGDRLVPVDGVDLQGTGWVPREAGEYLAELLATPSLTPTPIRGSPDPAEAIPPIPPAPDPLDPS